MAARSRSDDRLARLEAQLEEERTQRLQLEQVLQQEQDAREALESEFAEQRGWSVEGQTVTFSKMEDEMPAQKLPSTQLIQETLAYAKELERIV